MIASLDLPDATTLVFWGGVVIIAGGLVALILALREHQVRHRWLLLASEALDAPSLVRGPLGVVTFVRGSLDGEAVSISKKGVALQGEERVLLLGAEALAALAGDREELVATLRGAILAHRAGSLVRGAAAGATCPYCKDAIATREREGVIRCAACESLHHTPCWQEHGGCSVHGCARVPSGDAASRVREGP